MAKTKELGKLESIKVNLLATIVLSKEEYQINPTCELYSIITDLELTLKEVLKISK